MNFIVRAALSLAFYLYFFATTMAASAVLGLVRLLSRCMDQDGRLLHRLTRALSYHYVAWNPGWQIVVERAELLHSAPTFVMVANHQSLADPLVLSRLDAHYKWVAKIQVWNLLGVGQLMRVNDYMPVAHGELRSVRRMMRRAAQWLRQGVSIFIFPEGERSFDGNPMQFKDGPFRLACETNTPVLPIVIDGTLEILSRGQWLIDFQAPVRLKLLSPVHPASVNYDAKRLNAVVADMIEAELAGLPCASLIEHAVRPTSAA